MGTITITLDPKKMSRSQLVHEFETRCNGNNDLIKRNAELEDALSKTADERSAWSDAFRFAVGTAAKKYIEEKGWKECPIKGNDGQCECPSETLLDEFAGSVFFNCELCPFFETS